VTAPLADLIVSTRNGAAFAVFSGEIDLSNACDFDRQLHDEVGTAASVVIDLCAVTFIDSQGVRLLHRMIDRHVAGEISVCIKVTPESVPSDVLTITAVDRLVPVVQGP
jgi:anti-anti-sigma factor